MRDEPREPPQTDGPLARCLRPTCGALQELRVDSLGVTSRCVKCHLHEDV